MDEPIRPELQSLATRIEALSPSLEVVGVKKPGWQNDSKTPLYLSSYSLEVRDRDTSEVYMITTEKLFTSGIENVDQTQARFMAIAYRRRLAARPRAHRGRHLVLESRPPGSTSGLANAEGERLDDDHGPLQTPELRCRWRADDSS